MVNTFMLAQCYEEAANKVTHEPQWMNVSYDIHNVNNSSNIRSVVFCGSRQIFLGGRGRKMALLIKMVADPRRGTFDRETKIHS